VELDLVRGVALASDARPDHPDLLLDPAPGRRIDVRPSEERLKRLDLRLLVVGRLDLHQVPTRHMTDTTV
jgi:hypothetical protein